MQKIKVAVALSGGVDSATSAALLVEQKYDVIGIFMKNWSDPIDNQGYCPWIDDQLEARRVAEKLNIPFYTFNFEKEYKERVLDYFLREYKTGRTPNPDVMCNKEIKFDLFLKQAKNLGADMIATGHYARIRKIDDRFYLLRGKDPNKDQSYFLWTLNQEQLRYTLFPIGELLKPEVREIAKKFNLPNAKRKDSQGICFVGPVELNQFLQRYLSTKKGFVRNSEGKIIGEHDGIYYYTIGQRHGLHLSKLEGIDRAPLYIKTIDAKKNEIIVDIHEKLYSSQLRADQLNWISSAPNPGIEIDLQVRYRQKAVKGRVVLLQNGEITIELKEPVWAVTPGQSLVMYHQDELCGGGIIEEAK